MAYVVLARKYRPQTLAEVIGQDAVVRTLRNAIALNRIHHAYLFTGARGVGKTSIARILAKSLNCEKGPTDTPCGVCAACAEIAQSNSPDVLEIDGASNTSVDDVRELREAVKYMPVRGKRKIYIIDEVHMLSTSAFNALLKTLEEPPEHVLFVFATTEPHKIPVTILSRCQRFDFRRVPSAVLIERLRHVATSEGLSIDDAAYATVAKAADGSVRDAMSLLDQVVAFSGKTINAEAAREALGLLDREKVRGLLGALLTRDRKAVSALVQGAYQAGVDLSEIAERLVEATRDLTLVKLTAGQAETLSGMLPDELAALSAQAETLSSADLHRLFNVIVKTAEETARSPFAHLTFEMGLLRACDLEPVAALADLVAELRGAAPKGGAGAPPASSGGGPPARSASTAAVTRAGPEVKAAEIRAPTSAAPTNTAPTYTPTTNAPAPTTVTAASAPTVSTAARAPAHDAPPAADAPSETPTSFRDFAARVTQLKPRLGAALEHVICTEFSPRGIVARAPQGQAIFTDFLLDQDGLREMAELTRKLFGHVVPFTLEKALAEAANDDTRTLADERRHARQEELSRLKKAGVEHPAVLQVIQSLGGEVRGVQVAQALSFPQEDYE